MLAILKKNSALSASRALDVAVVAALVLVAWLAYERFVVPAPGRVLDFKITEASTDGPSKAAFVAAEVAVDGGTLNDFAATALAIASAIPADAAIVSIERSDVPASVGHWRRTLARAQYGKKEKPPFAVSTPEPLLSAKEIAAGIEYSERAGLALTGDGKLLSSELDSALMNDLAAKHGVRADRVGLFTPLKTERGERSDWTMLEGPGSKHLEDLSRCYASKPRGTGDWQACR
jgi:hypothetical protein